ncbi:hypothetical protein [Pedobacter frigoris]|uniref:hypothetical protein n=1 Tax=Pedobacter frigoris TaxID=2571272 RepID=UPI00293148F7|nr:hypothetical protein [Pedobacter frigoris]
MKKILFLTLLATGYYTAAFCQQEDVTKEALKKKYENSDIDKELRKKMQSDDKYPDSIVLAPLHFVNSFIKLDTAKFEFSSISLDVEVKTKVPKSYSFYISPFNGAINGMPFYAGIQTKSGGKPIEGGNDISIGRGGIFSRWMERDKGALKTEGYYSSSDAEGDFISIRNKVKWDKGTYRLTLYKSGEIEGKPLPQNYKSKEIMFTWGEYEHSWVTMTVENLKTKEKTIIGSLAFPGKKLMFNAQNIVFLEQYGAVINFAKEAPKSMYGVINYKELPDVKLDIKNIMVNGRLIKPAEVITYHNRTHHPEQSKIAMPIPILSEANYDPKTGVISYDVGAFKSWK